MCWMTSGDETAPHFAVNIQKLKGIQNTASLPSQRLGLGGGLKLNYVGTMPTKLESNFHTAQFNLSSYS